LLDNILYSNGTPYDIRFASKTTVPVRFQFGNPDLLNTTGGTYVFNGKVAIGYNGPPDNTLTVTGSIGCTGTITVPDIQCTGTITVPDIQISGNCQAASFNAISDLNKKENINTILNATEKMSLLRGVSYNLKSDKDNKKHYGVIAQELEKVFPDMVNGEEGNKSVAYMEIIGVLIETVKDLNKRIENLEQSSNN